MSEHQSPSTDPQFLRLPSPGPEHADALLLPLPLGRAWERLEAMRRTVATQPFAPEHGAELMRLTFSAGIASWPQDGADLSQLLRRADLRLRHAKLEGRNWLEGKDFEQARMGRSRKIGF